MTTQHGILGLVGICLTVIVLSLAGLMSDFVTRLLTSIDGLLLLMVCLMMAGIFSWMLFSLAKEAGWLPSPRKKQAAGASAPNPGPGKSGEGK